MINNIVSQNNVSSRVNLETKVDPRVVKSGKQVSSVSNQQPQQQLPVGLKVGVSEQNEVFAHQHNVALTAFKNFGKDGAPAPFNSESAVDILAEYEKIREAANAILKDQPVAPAQKQANTSQESQTAAVTESAASNFVSDMSGSFKTPQYSGAYNLSFGNTGINTFNNAPVYNTASNALNAAIAQGYQPENSNANTTTDTSSSLPPAAQEALAKRSRPYVEANTNSDKSGLTPVAVRTPSPITNPATSNAAITATSDSPMSEQASTQQAQDNNAQSEQTSNTDPKKPNGEAFTEAELAKIEDLKARDEEVRVHENAHKTAGGQFAGSPSYSYTTGPDGKRYITDGEVSIDLGEESDPQATIDKMQQVKRAALAPAQPSGQDRNVYNQANQIEAQARQDLNEQKREEAQNTAQSSASSSASESKPAVQNTETKPAVQNTEPQPAVQNTRNSDQQNVPASNSNAPAVQGSAQNNAANEVTATNTNQSVQPQANENSGAQQNTGGLVPSSTETPTPNTPKAADTATLTVNNNDEQNSVNVENEARNPAAPQIKSLSANEEEVGPDI